MSKTRIYIFFILFVLLPGVNSFGEVFNTSKCFDLLCSPQYIDHLKDDSRFAELCVDPDFIANVAEINSNCSASKLCNLYLSPELMAKLGELDSDAFYRSKESVAQKHGEGRNEAFVVAAEVYISNRLGIRDPQNVYDEFSQYVDGSLVLAPIIYTYLTGRNHDESYNDFLLRLFETGILKSGAVETNYNDAMASIQSQIKN